MIGALDALPEALRKWRDNRSLIYQFVTAVAATLVVASCVDGPRPSLVLANVARSIGAGPVSMWLSDDAPPFLAATNPQVQEAAFSLSLVLLVCMVVVPLWRSRDDGMDLFGYEQLRLLGSPAASTVWILLLVAAQQGDVAPTLREWKAFALTIAGTGAAGLMVVGATAAILARLGLSTIAGPLVHMTVRVAHRGIWSVGAVLVAVTLAAIAFPLAVVSWASGLQSDQSRDSR